MMSIPAPLRPYVAYVVAISLLVPLTLFYYTSKSYDEVTRTTSSDQPVQDVVYAMLVVAVFLVVYSARLAVPYLLGRFWANRGKNHTAQAIWSGAIGASCVPEAGIICISIVSIQEAGTCDSNTFGNCEAAPLLIMGLLIISIILEIFGIFIGFLAGLFKDSRAA